MSTPVRILSGGMGLNTVVDPIRLPFDPETGISDLAVAVNVTVDETGCLSRRNGYLKVRDESSHSLFCDGGDCLFVSGDTLYRLLPDYSVETVRTGFTEWDRMAYVQVNNDIYYSNSVELGIVRSGGVPENWVAQPYVGPETNRVFDGPRPGTHLAFAFGRIFVADGDVLWWSEPFGFAWFDRTRNFIQFPRRIVMVKAVAGGLYVSDEKHTYFLRGTDPKEFIQVTAAGFPALEWSEAIDLVEGFDIGVPDPGLCALWASREGACMGTPGGVVVNLNKKKVIYPEQGSWGAGLLRGYNYIHTIGV